MWELTGRPEVTAPRWLLLIDCATPPPHHASISVLKPLGAEFTGTLPCRLFWGDLAQAGPSSPEVRPEGLRLTVTGAPPGLAARLRDPFPGSVKPAVAWAVPRPFQSASPSPRPGQGHRNPLKKEPCSGHPLDAAAHGPWGLISQPERAELAPRKATGKIFGWFRKPGPQRLACAGGPAARAGSQVWAAGPQDTTARLTPATCTQATGPGSLLPGQHQAWARGGVPGAAWEALKKLCGLVSGSHPGGVCGMSRSQSDPSKLLKEATHKLLLPNCTFHPSPRKCPPSIHPCCPQSIPALSLHKDLLV